MRSLFHCALIIALVGGIVKPAPADSALPSTPPMATRRRNSSNATDILRFAVRAVFAGVGGVVGRVWFEAKS